MTKADREFAGQLKRFIKTQTALLATNDLDDKHGEEEIAAHLAKVKAKRIYLKALRAENRAERTILTRVITKLAKMRVADRK